MAERRESLMIGSVPPSTVVRAYPPLFAFRASAIT